MPLNKAEWPTTSKCLLPNQRDKKEGVQSQKWDKCLFLVPSHLFALFVDSKKEGNRMHSTFWRSGAYLFALIFRFGSTALGN